MHTTPRDRSWLRRSLRREGWPWHLSFLLLWLALLTPALAHAQPLLPRPVFDALAGEFSGETAREHLSQIIQHHRIQGSPMMAESAQIILAGLRRAGVPAAIERFASDGQTRWAGHTSPMGWTMRGGELFVESAAEPGFVPFRLCRYQDVPMCVTTYSAGGPFGGELVEVGRGTRASDYQGRDVRGKVALASGYAAEVVRQAVLVHGAVGVVIYPAATDRPEHPDLIRYNGVWPVAADLPKTRGGFQISANQYARLQALMQRGKVVVRGHIDATLGRGSMTLVNGLIKGREEPEREVLLTAHLDHPKWSANDNASGSAALLELARTLAALIKAGKVPPPRRSIRFLWVPEFSGTYAYVARHPEARRCGGGWDDPRGDANKSQGRACVVANLNLDMVGEDTVKTTSTFYVTRAPASVPSLLDALLSGLLSQVRAADLHAPAGTRVPFRAEVMPFLPGSDHQVLLSLGIPGSMFGHAGDWTHHSSADILDNTDASELLRVGVLAGGAALWLAGAGPAEVARLWPRVQAERVARLAERLGRLQAAGTPRFTALATRVQARLALAVRALAQPAPGGPFPEAIEAALAEPGSAGQGPRHLAVQPLPDEALRALPAADQATMDELEAHLEKNALIPSPGLDVVIFELVNLLDGRRGASELADLLSEEFLVDIQPAQVEHLLRVLAARQQVRL